LTVGTSPFMAVVARLWLLRHGQSRANVIRAAAGVDVETLDIPDRDMDVPLSELGRQQAIAFGHWLTSSGVDLPDIVLSSPYRRALETAEAVSRHWASHFAIGQDERLRERDLGAMDLLTTKGFAARYPEEAAHRKRIGKFYYRPPGGESWVDVALRCRSLLDTIARDHAGARVLLITHEVVIIIMRYVLEQMDETRALALSRDGAVANCSLTSYSDERGKLVLDTVDWVAPLVESGVPITEAPERPGASR
jgi:2,3-bisphosphoglycerate-dependent phosphoglycerate mutase